MLLETASKKNWELRNFFDNTECNCTLLTNIKGLFGESISMFWDKNSWALKPSYPYVIFILSKNTYIVSH